MLNNKFSFFFINIFFAELMEKFLLKEEAANTAFQVDILLLKGLFHFNKLHSSNGKYFSRICYMRIAVFRTGELFASFLNFAKEENLGG